MNGTAPSNAVRTRQLVDLIDALKLSLDGEVVTVDVVQTRIRKLGTTRQAERVVKEMIETASSLGFAARRVPFLNIGGEMVPFFERLPSNELGRWGLIFDRPEELLGVAQAEFGGLTGTRQPVGAKVLRRRATQLRLRALYREHGLCTQCKGQVFKAGLCETHYKEAREREDERRRRHKELGLCSYCSAPVFKGGFCEDHYLAAQVRIREAQQERREEGLCVVLGCEGDAFKGGLCQRHYEAAQKRRAEYRRSHREQGLCIECDEKATHGICCAEHVKARRKRRSRRRSDLVSMGLCRECGEPSGGRSYCKRHEEEYQARQKQRYAERRTAGRCRVCSGEPEPGKALCADCRAAQAESEKRVAAARAAGGTCVKCGKEPPVAGKTKCQTCIEKQAERGRRHYEKIKASPFCVQCRKRPKAEGVTYCAECLEERRLKQARRRMGSNPGDKSDRVILYHGTVRRKLPAILRRGLAQSEGWGGAGTFGVFLSGSPEGALYWAKTAYLLSREEKLDVARFDRHYGDRVGELLAIVEVAIPPEATENLRADMEQAEDVGFEGEPEDWRASLEEIGDVMYDGKVPASWLREVDLPA